MFLRAAEENPASSEEMRSAGDSAPPSTLCFSTLLKFAEVNLLPAKSAASDPDNADPRPEF
jgi:hypothetical protein